MFTQPVPPVPLAQLIDSGIRLSWPESVALVQSLSATSVRGEASAGTGRALDDYGIDASGCVVPLTGTGRPIPLGELALFLGQLLPAPGADGSSRAPGGVHLAIGRALGLVEAPPLSSVEQFAKSLTRFERGARCELLRSVFERCRATAPGQPVLRRADTADDERDDSIDTGTVSGDGRHGPATAARAVERRTTVPSADVLRRLLREADRTSFERLASPSPPAEAGCRRHNTPGVDALRRLLREADRRNYELSLRRRRDPEQVAYAALVVAALFALAAGVGSRDYAGMGRAGSRARGTAAAVRRGPSQPSGRPDRGDVIGRDRTRRMDGRGHGAAGIPVSPAPPQRTLAPSPNSASSFGESPNAVRSAAPPRPRRLDAISPPPDRAEPGHLVQALDVGRRPIFSPSFAADGSAVFFDERDGAGSSLMQARKTADGQMHVVSVVSDGAANYHPQLSPDGRTIAFDSDRDGVRGVYLASRDGRNVRRVSGPGYAAVPTWSPDGTRLAFIRAEDGHPRVWNLWSMDLRSGSLSRLTSFAYGQSWGASWFPDARRICYSHEDALVILDPDAHVANTYRSPRPGRLVRTPAVSPDGRYVMFQVYRDGAWLLDLNDGSMRKVLDDPSAEEFAWAPNGRQVAFHSRRGGDWGLWFMAPSQ